MADTTAHTARRAAVLDVARGGVSERRFPLTDSIVRIGRAHDNDLVLEDSTKGVSRYHAEIRLEATGYVLVDLASQNGTWVGAERVDRAPLQPGSEVAIGPYRLSLLELAGEAVEHPTESVSAGSSTGAIDAAPGPAPTTDPQRIGPPPPVKAAPRSASRRLAAPVLYALAGGAVVIVAALSAVVLIGGRAVTPPPPPACGCTASDRAAQLLHEAERLVAAASLEDARKTLARVREWRPDDARGLALLTEVDERRAVEADDIAPPAPLPTPPAATTPAPAEQAKARPSPADAGTGLTRGSGEKRSDFEARVRAASQSYDAVLAAVAKEDPKTAAAALATLEQLAPNHPKLPPVRRAVQHLVDGSGAKLAAVLQEAHDLDAAGNLAGARRKLVEAEGLKSGSATVALQQLTGRMAQLGEQEFSKGKAREIVGNSAQARAFYQRALELLPPDHKDRPDCEARLRALQ